VNRKGTGLRGLTRQQVQYHATVQAFYALMLNALAGSARASLCGPPRRRLIEGGGVAIFEVSFCPCCVGPSR
jgi:hypothetical protein